MNVAPPGTETVVRNHLEAFLEQRGTAAMVDDYDDDARLLTEGRVYRGKREIGGFFDDFLASLPAGALDRFTLRSLRVDGGVALITWHVGRDISLGTDTFVVDRGKIVSQAFAMSAAAAARSAFIARYRVRAVCDCRSVLLRAAPCLHRSLTIPR